MRIDLAIFVVVGIATAAASTLRIRRASGSTEIDVLDVRTKVQSRFATTVIKSVLKNTGDESEEAQFSVILPANAFISNFTMLIDGKLIVGDVREKEAARIAYQEAKESGQTAGHVLQNTRETDRFDTAVNVAKGASVSFELTYDEILERVHSVYKHVFNLQAPSTIPTLLVHATIQEQRKITKVVVPEIGDRVGEKTNKDLKNVKNDANVDIDQIDSVDGSTVNVIYSPSVDEQRALKIDSGEAIRAQMTVLYDVERSDDGGELLVADGYFVHFFAPSTKTRQPKRIVFVIDISGSMGGTKMMQTIEAMEIILADLTVADTFNIVIFDDDVFVWNAGFRGHIDVEDAKKYVRSLVADGGTNIHSGMLKAISLFDKPSSVQADMIIFLTDGQASSGIQDPTQIIGDIKEALEEKKIVVHTLSFGNGADFDLLKKIAFAGDGLGKKIYEDSDSAIQMEGFYSQVGNPIMTNVDIKYLNVSLEPNSVQQDVAYNYYEGGEIVVVGKLAENAPASSNVMTAVVEADSAAGRRVMRCMPIPCYTELECPGCEIPSWCEPRVLTTTVAPLNARSYDGFIQRMWAYRSIKKLLKELEESDSDKATKVALEADALRMSLKYNFVTSLTSMVVVQDNIRRPGEGRAEALAEADLFSGAAPAAPLSSGGARPPGNGGGGGGALGASIGRVCLLPQYCNPMGAQISPPGFAAGDYDYAEIAMPEITLAKSTLECVNGGLAQVTNASRVIDDVNCPCGYQYSCEKLVAHADKYACCSLEDTAVHVCEDPHALWSLCSSETCYPTCAFIKGGGEFDKYGCSTVCGGYPNRSACRCEVGYAMNDDTKCVKIAEC